MAFPPVSIQIAREQWQFLEPSSETAGEAWENGAIELGTGTFAERLRELVPKARRAYLLLDSSMCLTASFQLESTRQLRKRESLLYKLEELIPFAAEDVNADFIRRGNQVFAIAALRRWILPAVEALSQSGFRTELITPSLVLAWTKHFTRNKSQPQEIVVWVGNSGSTDLVLFRDGHPVFWEYFSSSNETLQRCCNQIRLNTSGSISYSAYVPDNHNWPAIDLWESVFRGNVFKLEGDPVQNQALQVLSDIHLGRTNAPVDLLLAPPGSEKTRSKPKLDTVLLQFSIFVLLASMVYSNVMGTKRHEAAISQAIARQKDVVQSVFPDSRLPRGFRARLEGELAKLAGARANSEDETANRSVLPLLFRLLEAIPENLRFRLLDVQIEDEQLDLVGEVRDFSDADQIATSIRALGFQVTPPTTQRLEKQGVGFRLHAEYLLNEEKNGSL